MLYEYYPSSCGHSCKCQWRERDTSRRGRARPPSGPDSGKRGSRAARDPERAGSSRPSAGGPGLQLLRPSTHPVPRSQVDRPPCPTDHHYRPSTQSSLLPRVNRCSRACRPAGGDLPGTAMRPWAGRTPSTPSLGTTYLSHTHLSSRTPPSTCPLPLPRSPSTYPRPSHHLLPTVPQLGLCTVVRSEGGLDRRQEGVQTARAATRMAQ